MGFEPTTIPRLRGSPIAYKLRASTHQRSSECPVAMPGLATGPQNAICSSSVYRDFGVEKNENKECSQETIISSFPNSVRSQVFS